MPDQLGNRDGGGSTEGPLVREQAERRSVLQGGASDAQSISPLRWLIVALPVLVIVATAGLLVQSALNRPIAVEVPRDRPATPDRPGLDRKGLDRQGLGRRDVLPAQPQPQPQPGAVPSPAKSQVTLPWDFDAAEIVARLPVADLRNGRAIFTICAVCHSAEPAGGHRIGPKLWNIIGREKASHPDYPYSSALQLQGGRWTYEDLARYLYDTRSAVPGGKMAFAGIRDPAKLADVVAFVRTLADRPEALPKGSGARD